MTLGPGYFDSMYDASADPWGLETRWYEQRKYQLSLAMLPWPRYRRAFEPGCSVGVLTELVAPRCASLLCCDVSDAAVAAAAARTGHLPGVTVERRAIPQDWPAGSFDLIILSEILYYFAGDDLRRVLDRAVLALRPGGSLLAVHWLHPVADYPRCGEEVHAAVGACRGLARLARHRERDFLAEVFVRADGEPASVAQATGLA